MKYPRIMIAAPRSGTGKTTITCGLLKALKDMGKSPCSFKCGPDYIDPLFHRRVLDISAGNLDTFFTDADTTRWIFTEEYSGDFAIIEGVMGLYDGMGGINEMGSSYDLASVLNCPIVLVIDAHGMGKSTLAEIKGFLDYDKNNLIAGVILNRTNPTFGAVLKPIIEKELGIRCLGALPKNEEISLSSRYLGLVLPNEVAELNTKLQQLSDAIKKEIDIDGIIDIANSSIDFLDNVKMPNDIAGIFASGDGNKPLRLAVARDNAFCFYYRENLKLLEGMGVELVEFSPMNDNRLPNDISGLLLGGGYPEDYLKELSNNIGMLNAIKNAALNGMPILAECGGFMYLMDEIIDNDNNAYKMAGVINGNAIWKGKLVRFGYVIIESDDIKIKGHEFHYFDTDNNGDDCTATKPSNNRSYKCIHRSGGSFVGFTHLYYYSSPKFIKNFVEAMKTYGGQRNLI